MENEQWLDVPGYGEHYQASSFGNIKSKDRIVLKRHSSGAISKQFYKGKILNPSNGEYGHLYVHIGIEKKKFTVSVHKLVMLAFVGPCPQGMECCHGNGNPKDNRPENLRWDTHAANNADRKKHGRYFVGADHPMAKLSEEQARAIKYYGMHYSEIGIKYPYAWQIKTGKVWKHV